jgi:hypothetical protein
MAKALSVGLMVVFLQKVKTLWRRFIVFLRGRKTMNKSDVVTIYKVPFSKA